MSGEAIAERGEHEIVLAGVTYRLRPSHAAMRAIEKKTGRSMIELLRAGNAGALTLDELGHVTAELIRAGADDEATRHVDAERISELLYEEGLYRAMSRCTMCLVDAASGGRKSSGEAKAAAETNGTAGAD